MRAGRPSKTADYRKLVASIVTAQPGLKTLEVPRPADYRGGETAWHPVVRELRRRAVRPICRFEDVAGEFSQHDFGQARARWTGSANSSGWSSSAVA